MYSVFYLLPGVDSKIIQSTAQRERQFYQLQRKVERKRTMGIITTIHIYIANGPII